MTASAHSGQAQQLLDAARKAMLNAHAPYSNFLVGAALLTTTGEMFSGCNVENASYGLTNCAERTAIFSAVASLGETMRIASIAVVTQQKVACSPCGACRQVIAEFSSAQTTILYQGTDGIKTVTMAELLPDSFRL